MYSKSTKAWQGRLHTFFRQWSYDGVKKGYKGYFNNIFEVLLHKSLFEANKNVIICVNCTGDYMVLLVHILAEYLKLLNKFKNRLERKQGEIYKS